MPAMKPRPVRPHPLPERGRSASRSSLAPRRRRAGSLERIVLAGLVGAWILFVFGYAFGLVEGPTDIQSFGFSSR
jgi:hypothetical protein